MHPVDILVRCEHNLYILWDRFKHIGYNQYLKSSQLRKKLCHFMIMVLSCFDLITVVTNHPGILVNLIFWSRENYYLLPKIRIYLNIFNVLLIFSPFALLVMSIERYVGAYYPVFHHTSVTRRRLRTLFTFSGIILNTSVIISMRKSSQLRKKPCL